MFNLYESYAKSLKRKYGKYFEEFRQYNDDRQLVPNMGNQLLKALDAMNDMKDHFVRAAFNKAYAEQEKQMERIVTRFTGKVWRDFEWQDAETIGG